MSDKELYNLLCGYKTSTHHRKLNKLMQTETITPTTRCIQQIFKLIIQLCTLSDGVGASQLVSLLSVLLPYNKYQVVDEGILRSLKALHSHLTGIKKTHHIYKIYHPYIQLITEMLDAKLKRSIPVPNLFAPVLFNIAMDLNGVLTYELRMEVAKSLNVLLEEHDGNALHEYLTELPEVKAQWLDIGEAVKSSGDYELQVTLMELLFRLMSPPKRNQNAGTLFPGEPKLQELFLSLCDEQFERDCRVFLNVLNSGLKQRMVYSFKCSRVNVGTENLQIPPNQDWFDVNFGSKIITMFIILPAVDGGGEFDTLIINPTNVVKHEHTVDQDNFHLVLKLNIPVSSLLDSKTGGDSRTIHFVLDTSPDPKGAILGLLGQHFPDSPKLSRLARVDVSEETIQICGNVTKIVSTPVSERTDRLSQTRKMLETKISDPLPQFEIGLSQPEKQRLKSFIASEPILTNPRAPQCSPVEDSVIRSSVGAIPDSLPVSVIPDSQIHNAPVNAKADEQWQLHSSFDYTDRIEESEISIVGEDTIKDFAKDTIAEEHPEADKESCTEEESAPRRDNPEGAKSLNQSNLASAVSSKSSKKLFKKPLKFEETEPAAVVICVGKQKAQVVEKPKEAIKLKIQNKFEKRKQVKPDSKPKKETAIDDKYVIKVEYEEVIEIEKPESASRSKTTEVKRKQICAKSPMLSTCDNSPNLSQELEQINHDISFKITNSPGDVYKSILKDGLKDLPRKILSPVPTELEKSFKRRLMDTEENFLCSQDSQETLPASQAKKVPAFARKRVPSHNTSSSFVVSKNKSLQKLGTRVKGEEAILDEIIPLPPARKSILKKKLLDKTPAAAPRTPQLGTFDFDEKSPAKSEASWMKTDKKKKRTAGFKTKKQKLEEEKAAKRMLKEEKEKDRPMKKLKKKRQKDAECSSEEETPVADEENIPKLEIKTKSPSPPPQRRSTRYSMRRAPKRVNYRDPGSDEDIVSVSASEFSTTTTSTVIIPSSRISKPPLSPTLDPEPVALLADLNASLERDDEELPEIGIEVANSRTRRWTFMPSHSPLMLQGSRSSEACKESHESETEQGYTTTADSKVPCAYKGRKSTTSEDIAILSGQYDDPSNQYTSPITAIQDEEDITCIPSTDKVGIPLSFKTDVSSIPSMVSKDPSPIIKTNFFKLPTGVIRSIQLNLSPQVKEISPDVLPIRDDSSGTEENVLFEVFEEQVLEKETEKLKRNTKKYTRRGYTKSAKKKVNGSVGTVDTSATNEHLEKLQESFDQINQSTVLEVAVTKLSDVQRTVVEEEQSLEQGDKVWLEWWESGPSYSAKGIVQNQLVKNIHSEKQEKCDVISKQITSMAPDHVTETDMSVQFHAVSHCMVTEADSSGLLMEIEDYNTPVSDEVKEQDVQNMFSSILEESRLAGERTNAPSTLISTPTKLSHIREAEKANVSPFQQFLERIGGVKSPIKEMEAVGKQDKSASSRMYDSGIGMAGQTSANMSLPALSITEHELSNGHKLNSPTKTVSTSYCISPPPPPPAKHKTTFSSQSPGRQEIEEYYEMLCKTPGKVSQYSIPSSQGLSGDVVLPVKDYQLPVIKFSPLAIVDRPTGSSSLSQNTDCLSQNSSFIIPPYMLDTESGVALQMIQNSSKKMKEKQKQKSKENVELIANDLNEATFRFFDNSRIKRKSTLNKMTEDVHGDIATMECELSEIKRKERIALQGIAQAHKVQKESRITLENKMKLLKQKGTLENSFDEMEGLRELRQSLLKQLQLRQAQLDKNQIQQQRKQLMKQMALIMMNEFE